MKRFIFLFLTLVLSACIARPTPEPTSTASAPFVIKQEENPYPPRPDDTSKRRGGVILTSMNLSERTDFTPLQNEFHVLGSMPSSCSELRITINPPNDTYQIFIEIYSVVDPNLKCENVFQQFDATLLLGIYSAGRYTIWANDGFVGDFISN